MSSSLLLKMCSFQQLFRFIGCCCLGGQWSLGGGGGGQTGGGGHLSCACCSLLCLSLFSLSLLSFSLCCCSLLFLFSLSFCSLWESLSSFRFGHGWPQQGHFGLSAFFPHELPVWRKRKKIFIGFYLKLKMSPFLLENLRRTSCNFLTKKWGIPDFYYKYK